MPIENQGVSFEESNREAVEAAKLFLGQRSAAQAGADRLVLCPLRIGGLCEPVHA
ncbi:hypothetical protein ACFPM3_06700 [Streptomyces coeruleoprunus]|uniref:Uncharacterized protein n=1 Tax=Streptomyces coeruleoprunus TaxID=285563 RepID=A0ABV9XAQ2_9ACTN